MIKNIIISFLLILNLFSCKTLAPNQSNENKMEIRKDYPNYTELWKELARERVEGRPESAQKIADQIYELAKQEENIPQIYKALIFQSKYTLVLQENADLTVVNRMKTEIAEANSPQKQILQSALAELYWQYFQSNRYKFSNRTATDGGIDKTDFRTWDLARLFAESSSNFDASLQNPDITQQYLVEDFGAILSNLYSKDSTINEFQYLRPTLFDLLSHRAINFYGNSASSLPKPTDHFVLRNEKAFAPIDEFLTFQPQTTDSLSHVVKTINIYQNLLRFHKNAGNTHALVQANLDRLEYVYQNAQLSNKNQLYESALQNILQSFKGEDIASNAGYYLAKFYRNQGVKYQNNQSSSDTKDNAQWKLKKAVEICDEIIANYPNSYGVNQCKVLRQQITEPQIQIRSLENLPVQKPFRFLVNYKNSDQLHFSIAKVSPQQLDTIKGLYRKKLAAKLTKLKPLFQWTAKVPNQGDYQEHSFEEIAAQGKGLPPGQYIITASPEKQLSASSNHFGWAYIQVTDLTYVSQENNEKGGVDVYVKDRSTGMPVPNAKVWLTTRNKQSGYQLNKSVITDKLGFININFLDNRYYDVQIKIEAHGKTAIFNNFRYTNYLNRDNKRWNNRALLFTDRSIYRPGQTIYFKAIAFESNGETSELITNKVVPVKFYDKNREVIEELSLQTNDYGSVQGSFVIPRGRLLGTYRIDIPGFGSTAFSVEEYKRPQFQVELDSLEGNYVLGHKITAKGQATSYAGTNISNAKVQYRVTRTVRFPFWYSWFRPMPRGEEMEIAFGETTTDAQGNFEIPFTALPDENVEAVDQPIFNYKIKVDVTDINGETRSDETIVNVGYTAMQIELNTKREWEKNSKPEITVVTQNLNDQPLATSGSITIYKLKAPEQVLVERDWQAPDQQIISEQEWEKYFPHQPYKQLSNSVGGNYYPQSEKIPTDWENGELVLEQEFSTSKQGKETIQPNVLDWNAGWYKLEAIAKDAYGKQIKQQQYIYLSDMQSLKVADNELLRLTILKDEYKPGETATIRVGTAAEQLDVLVQVYRDNDKIHQEQLTLHNEVEEVNLPIQEIHRGGLLVKVMAVKWNHRIQEDKIIQVPWKNKKLTIETKTFRNKLKPGGEETWSFTVEGPNSEQVNTELLVNMYDVSLDQFKTHTWSTAIPRRQQGSYGNHFRSLAFGTTNFRFQHFNQDDSPTLKQMNFAGLRLFDLYLGSRQFFRNRGQMISLDSPGSPAPTAVENSLAIDEEMKSKIYAFRVTERDEMADMDTMEKENESKSLDVVARKNLQETAFFFPQLTTDAEGNISFTFTTPEALTEWKVMAFGHTKELQTGYWEGSTVTQKELMVTPNAPRYFRENDEINFTTKVSNLTNKNLTGQAELQLLNATNLQPVYGKFAQDNAIKTFQVDAQGNTTVSWHLTIPENVPAVTYRVLAKTDNFTDGVENALPVLSNRMLVTESLPIPLRSNETKEFQLEKLVHNTSSTLTNHKLTLEMTSNPAWYAVQALPYLMEYPYECSEQIFSRYYANSLATHIANSDPKIKAVFDAWRNYQPDALKSNLEKNEELKSLLLRETPWVRDAASEAEQKRRIALLFDINRMAEEQRIAMQQLQQQQYANGGWPWFSGGETNRFISQHIVAGLGHLDQLKVKNVRENKAVWNMTQKAIQFLDNQLTEDFEELKRHNENWQDVESLSQIHAHYFYTRSFFKDVEVKGKNREAFDFYFNLLKKDWLHNQVYYDGLAALTFHRYGESELAQKLVTSLKERSITNEEMGMYWKGNRPSWWWYQAPIETQALMIEVFDEVADDQQAVDELKVWLLKNKQTNSWETTKATAEAVYALLLRGGNWLAVDDLVEIELGGKTIDPSQIDGVEVEAGTGYFKTSWSGEEITPQMGKVKATKTGEGIAWGALYWQYFEDLDKITKFEDTPLQLKKQLFLQENTKSGPKISPVVENQKLEIGDLLKVRIELRVDRDMEFVHMKDMRAAGFEPINVLSQYKWQDGLGYYESTKDASTDFFFDYLPKGVYVFEYALRVNNSGEFSNGITTIQSMYAPEFTSHSQGIRVVVK